jgi:hypothetical protein
MSEGGELFPFASAAHAAAQPLPARYEPPRLAMFEKSGQCLPGRPWGIHLPLHRNRCSRCGWTRG